ncbi:hypothetical protein ABVT39_014144 [Epinephelus coioides]
MSVTMLATLLDPSFKVLGFYSQLKANKAVKRLRMECANVFTLQDIPPQMPPSATCDATAPGASTASTSSSGGSSLWHLLDSMVTQSRGPSNAKAQAIVEVQRYLAEQNIQRQHTHTGTLRSISILTCTNWHFSFSVHLLLQSPVRGCSLRLGKSYLRRPFWEISGQNAPKLQMSFAFWVAPFPQICCQSLTQSFARNNLQYHLRSEHFLYFPRLFKQLESHNEAVT